MTKLKDVRAAHDKYASTKARWGDDNQATVREMIRFYDLKNAYEATGKVYAR